MTPVLAGGIRGMTAVLMFGCSDSLVKLKMATIAGAAPRGEALLALARQPLSSQMLFYPFCVSLPT
jgi:hypothetical protein